MRNSAYFLLTTYPTGGYINQAREFSEVKWIENVGIFRIFSASNTIKIGQKALLMSQYYGPVETSESQITTSYCPD